MGILPMILDQIGFESRAKMPMPPKLAEYQELTTGNRLT
jgi:hypothetical protein